MRLQLVMTESQDEKKTVSGFKFNSIIFENMQVRVIKFPCRFFLGYGAVSMTGSLFCDTIRSPADGLTLAKIRSNEPVRAGKKKTASKIFVFLNGVANVWKEIHSTHLLELKLHPRHFVE